MKKIALLIMCLFGMCVFSCGLANPSENNANNVSMEWSTDSENNVVLQWDDKIYSFYGPIDSDLLKIKGRQIGIVDGDSKNKILEVKGYDSNEWLIEYYDVFMTTYSLYKEEHVVIIPEGLKRYGSK